MTTLMNLVIFVAVIVGPLLVMWYPILWIRRGLDHGPAIAWTAIVVLVAVVVFAAGTYQHFFPGCFVWGYRGYCRQ